MTKKNSLQIFFLICFLISFKSGFILGHLQNVNTLVYLVSNLIGYNLIVVHHNYQPMILNQNSGLVGEQTQTILTALARKRSMSQTKFFKTDLFISFSLINKPGIHLIQKLLKIIIYRQALKSKPRQFYLALAFKSVFSL